MENLLENVVDHSDRVIAFASLLTHIKEGN